MSFILHFAKKQVDGLNDSVLGWLVNLDPEGASEAQLAEMEQQFDKANLELSKARADYTKEQGEADTAVAYYTKLLGAAQKLAADAAAETDPARKTVLQGKADAITTELEGKKSDVQTEKQEAADAKALYEELDQAVRAAGERLKTARSRITHAQKDMQKAQSEQERAEHQAEHAAAAAGLRHAASAADTATSIFEKHAADARAAADAARRKASILTPTATNLADDPDVKAAMGVVPPPADTQSRLAALAL